MDDKIGEFVYINKSNRIRRPLQLKQNHTQANKSSSIKVILLK